MIGIQIDARDLQRISGEFAATEPQVRAAWRRAKGRTARRLRTQARKALRQGLNLRAAAVLRARLRLRNTRDGASLWVGLNDVRASDVRGAKITSRGFRFNRQMFERVGDGRLPIRVQTVPIKDEGDAILEREVINDAAETLMRNFVAELRARTIYQV